MNWTELDALADELRRTLLSGVLRTLPSELSDLSNTLTPERLARIALADVNHARAWERTHGSDPSWNERKDEIAWSIEHVLARAHPQARL
jgi:hypothetical protein